MAAAVSDTLWSLTDIIASSPFGVVFPGRVGENARVRAPQGREGSSYVKRTLAEKALAGRCVMAVSDAAVREIAKVLLKHVDQESLQKVVDDLLDLRGDKSFRDMIATLARELKAGF